MGALVDAGVPFEALRDGVREARPAGMAPARPRGHEGRRSGPPRSMSRSIAAQSAITGSLAEILGHPGRQRPPATVGGTRRGSSRRLAEAEARVHGTTPRARALPRRGRGGRHRGRHRGVIGLDLLGVDAVARLGAAGRRRVRRAARTAGCRCPAPGTAELLQGFPVVDTGCGPELVTPTGAAILTTLAAGAGRDAGHDDRARRATGRGRWTCRAHPTCSAASWARLGRARPEPIETIVQIETTWTTCRRSSTSRSWSACSRPARSTSRLTPVIMKRSRPGTVLTALCGPAGSPSSPACSSRSPRRSGCAGRRCREPDWPARW